MPLSCLALAIAITEIYWPSHQIICRSGIGSPLSTRPHNTSHVDASSLSGPFSLPRGFILPARTVKSKGYLPCWMFEVPSKEESPLSKSAPEPILGD